MAYTLPIVGTVQDGGVAFRVRALPWGLAREASRPGADTEALSAKIYDRCVEAEDRDGHPIAIPVDELPASLVGRLVELAANGKAEGPAADPTLAPPSTAPASGG